MSSGNFFFVVNLYTDDNDDDDDNDVGCVIYVYTCVVFVWSGSHPLPVIITDRFCLFKKKINNFDRKMIELINLFSKTKLIFWVKLQNK